MEIATGYESWMSGAARKIVEQIETGTLDTVGEVGSRTNQITESEAKARQIVAILCNHNGAK